MRKAILFLIAFAFFAAAQYSPPGGGTVTINGVGCTVGSSCTISGGALTQISRTALNATTASITFSSIPATYHQLEITLLGRGDTAAASVDVQIQMNGDSGTNYEYEAFSANGTSVAGAFTGGQTSAFICVIPGSTASATFPGACSIVIPEYQASTFVKSFHSQVGERFTTGPIVLAGMIAANWFGTPAAITSITIFPLAGNFVSGTTATLWGRT